MEAVHPVRLSQPRRPMALRDHPAIALAADLLIVRNVEPNAISFASVVFSGFSAAAIVATVAVPPVWAVPLLLVATLGIGFRGLCNVLDGLVAIEGGRATRVGPLFNEIPDRISDSLILIALGIASGATAGAALGIALGILAALLAMATAYIRLLGGTLLGTQSFGGPMAKQQRMLLAAAACLAATLLAPFGLTPYPMLIATAFIILGSAYTLVTRTRAIAAQLR
jgi:phosphatidylglycerophosphate synthase